MSERIKALKGGLLSRECKSNWDKGIRAHGPQLCGHADCDQIVGSVPGDSSLLFVFSESLLGLGLCGTHRRSSSGPEDDLL